MENETLEQMINAFMADQTKENKAKMLSQLQKARLFVPSNFQKGADISKLKQTAPGDMAKLPEDLKPIPIFIKSKEGDLYLPIYSSRSQIPKDVKPQVVMSIPFMALVAMALQENLHLAGMALNPFSQNILLKEPFLKMVKEQAAKQAAAAKGAVRLTPAQAAALLRRKVEFGLLPQAVFEAPKDITDKLCDEGESYLLSLYQQVYGPNGTCPFREDQLSLMPLNIRDDLLLIRIDFPDSKQQAPVALRGYVLYSEEKQVADYYAIEMGKEKGSTKVIRVHADTKCEDLGEASVEGAELQMVLDLYDDHHKSLN